MIFVVISNRNFRNMKRSLLVVFLSLSLFLTSVDFAAAQCAMCKQSAESSLKEGNTDAIGLNIGIMYLLVIPYVLVGGIGYYWYVNHKRQPEEESNKG